MYPPPLRGAAQNPPHEVMAETHELATTTGIRTTRLVIHGTRDMMIDMRTMRTANRAIMIKVTVRTATVTPQAVTILVTVRTIRGTATASIPPTMRSTLAEIAMATRTTAAEVRRLPVEEVR